ncbi:unnamed protein product [Ostreobium quekettii]|uniref:CNH domain-containing protein n=1 Tax=Ostreobium quekettii TaxID=121088 RepID=A0A8S1ITH4_9CHLO|nr:unnamed protein product [Ostreobium quekettii]
MSTADPEGSRTAFELNAVHQRRDQSRVTSVGVDGDGQRLYIGLDAGVLEEHRLMQTPSGIVARFSARRSVSKKGVVGICLLSAVNRLAALTEDGHVVLCELEQLEPVEIQKLKGATCLAVEVSSRSPSHLAVAVRLGSRKSRVDVYEVFPGAASGHTMREPARLLVEYPVPDEVKDLVWVGQQLVLCLHRTYKVIKADGLRDLLEPSTTPMCTALASANVAVLLWEDTMAVVADADGQAARPPLNLPAKPLRLMQGGMCIVAVCEGGDIHIYDQGTSRLLQRIPFPVNGFMNPDDPSQPQLFHADTPTGACVVLASPRRIWILRPVAPDNQAQQLLRGRSYAAALELAEQCSAKGEPWVPIFYAQAGLLLLQDFRWREAIECLEHCSIEVFQPCELFPLFPAWTEKWAEQVPLKDYWGLHGGLITLEKMVGVGRRYSYGGESPSADPVGISSSEMDRGPGKPSTSARDKHLLEAKQQIASYLLSVRRRAGVRLMDGIDTLIVHLLANVGDAGRLEDFLASPQQVVLLDVEQQLLDMGRPHALALLVSSHRAAARALDLWQRMANSQIKEKPARLGGAVSQAGGDATKVAKYHAAKLLAEEEDVDDELVLRHLVWLRDLAPLRFLQVVKARSLVADAVLGLLPQQPLALRWRYLDHLTTSGQTLKPQHHTELALVLVQAILEAEAQSTTETAQKDSAVVSAVLGSHTYQSKSSTEESSRGDAASSKAANPDVAAVGRYDEPDELPATSEAELHSVLQSHLHKSHLYDVLRVLRAVESTKLYKEQVILYCRLCDHPRALRVLAVTLREVGSAIAYCKQHGGQDGFLTLLEMLLHPGDGQQPMYTEACMVLNAESGNLDPMRVLEALSEDMPLQLANATLARMLRERIHRRRQTRIVAKLHRSRELLSRAEKYELQSTIKGRAVVTDESRCAVCFNPLAGRIFYVYPSSSMVCATCQRGFREGREQEDDSD